MALVKLTIKLYMSLLLMLPAVLFATTPILIFCACDFGWSLLPLPRLMSMSVSIVVMSSPLLSELEAMVTMMASNKVCAVCGRKLVKDNVQLRWADDEAATLVVSCPVHGLHHNLHSNYLEVENSYDKRNYRSELHWYPPHHIPRSDVGWRPANSVRELS